MDSKTTASIMTKRIFNQVFFALAVLASATGCKQNLDFAIPDDVIGFSTAEELNEVTVFNGKYDLSIIKSGKGTSPAKVTISLASAADLAAYNAAHSTAFAMAAAGSFTMPAETSFSFGATDTRRVTQLTWTPADFYNANLGADAVIPIKISECSIGTDSIRTLTLIRPYVSKAIFSLSSGTDLDLAQNDIKSLFPEGDELQPTDAAEGTAQLCIDKVIPTNDISLTLGIDNSYIATTATARGKEYVEAPEGFATIQRNVVLKAGELYADFSYSLDFSKLFDTDGKLLYFGKSILIPIVIKKAEPVGVSIGSVYVANIAVTIAESGVVIEPSSKPQEFWGNMDGVDGTGDEWLIVDGKQYAMAEDPNIESDWYKRYSADKLVDGIFSYDPAEGGGMGLWFWTPNVFPVPFTIDLGQDFIFKGFRLVYSKTHQNNFRHIRVSVAREYNEGTKEGDWKPAFEGTRAYDSGWQPWPEDGGSQQSLYEKFTFCMPEGALPASETIDSTFALRKGRYIKLELVEPVNSTGDFENGRGYLMEFYINGWKLE